MNSTITTLEISVAGSARAESECGDFWKAGSQHQPRDVTPTPMLDNSVAPIRQALADMLKSNATITCLKLGCNGIGDDSIKACAPPRGVCS